MTDARVTRALAGARPVPFWLDQPGAPEPLPALSEPIKADLAVVGGGFTGLWTALLAKEADPGRDVVLVEGGRAAGAATGRNGGFCAASLTHGLANGLDRFPAELATLEQLGVRNLDEIAKAVGRYGIDCDFTRSGEMSVATSDWQLAGLRETAATAARLGHGHQLLEASSVRAELNSPTYLGGLWDTKGCAIVDPARLAWGLRQACLDAGVRIYEDTHVKGVAAEPGEWLSVATAAGSVTARRVALATGAFSPLLRRLRYYLIPVYDYVLMTEPLSTAQLDSVGWRHRQGVGDSGNQFHYYRLTADNRILWGGYDAVYYYGSKITSKQDQRLATFRMLAEHFYQTFPQLEDACFSHKWGGVIDTCSRFCVFFGTARSGRLAYAACSSPAGLSPERTAAKAVATCGCERWTDSASASTRELLTS